ncbi:MAG: hypothetical protein LBV07_06300 [Syntrophobacterales bacterium]|nr:hypothetical protein [Syntrophobacterales bacterium]
MNLAAVTTARAAPVKWRMQYTPYMLFSVLVIEYERKEFFMLTNSNNNSSKESDKHPGHNCGLNRQRVSKSFFKPLILQNLG